MQVLHVHQCLQGDLWNPAVCWRVCWCPADEPLDGSSAAWHVLLNSGGVSAGVVSPLDGCVACCAHLLYSVSAGVLQTSPWMAAVLSSLDEAGLKQTVTDIKVAPGGLTFVGRGWQQYSTDCT